MAEVLLPRIGSFVAGRSAPVGMFWAAEVDQVGPGLAISREYALDHGLSNPSQYPSWVKYPDERDIPVGVEAGRRWKEREAKSVDLGGRRIIDRKNTRLNSTH